MPVLFGKDVTEGVGEKRTSLSGNIQVLFWATLALKEMNDQGTLFTIHYSQFTLYQSPNNHSLTPTFPITFQ